MAELQIVYVLTNPAMPSLVKIGQTSSMDAKNRLVQLYTTGVPFPFKLEFACKVSNSIEVEKAFLSRWISLQALWKVLESPNKAKKVHTHTFLRPVDYLKYL